MARTVQEAIAAGDIRLRSAGLVAVTNAAGGTRLLQANPQRVQVVIVNNEANGGHLTRAPNPATTTGIRLDAQGGFYVATREFLGAGITGEFWAILETAAGNFYVEEYEAVL